MGAPAGQQSVALAGRLFHDDDDVLRVCLFVSLFVIRRRRDADEDDAGAADDDAAGDA